MKDRYWKIRNSHVHKLSFVELFYCIIVNEILQTFRIDIEGLCIQITFQWNTTFTFNIGRHEMLDSFPQGSYNGPVFYCFSKLMSNKFQTHFINRYLSYNRGNLEWIQRVQSWLKKKWLKQIIKIIGFNLCSFFFWKNISTPKSTPIGINLMNWLLTKWIVQQLQ